MSHIVDRWYFDYGGTYHYNFARNPDRYGGDTGWMFEPRMSEMEIIGANQSYIQIDGFMGARRNLKFTAITGTMARILENFFLRKAIIYNCRDHLYPTHPAFHCFITSFIQQAHPTVGDFPGSGEDTYDVEMTLVKM
jgi:hypothetical protein